MADPEIEEIRRLQLERKKQEGTLISLSDRTISYDTELYGGSGRDEFDNSIGVNDDFEEEEESHFQTSKQKFLNSFTAPKDISKETYDQNEAEEDVFKDYKKKKIADKENDYQARWRNRAKLSPPRYDPYKGGNKGISDDIKNSHNSYRDVMLNATLEKERADVVRKIEQKMREERETKAREERRIEREKKELQKKLKKQAKKRERSRSPSDSERTPKGENKKRTSNWEKDEEEQWKLDVIKNGNTLESIMLEPDITYTCGKGESEIRLDHASCSRNHAKISFQSNRPHLMDLNSTNGTFLNSEEITAGQWYKLSDGDVIKFGCSTRDYRVKFG